ncbi:alkaline phosphatase D family protein [Photobacterium damselae]|uniref:alkaline phosphatase D family protein n=1 Tax=Photobacterium damselae TaxID=38293 RepID=UPI001EDD2F77|nr:alkaline phosphatase D family protein [Photobacterium damselae]MCG3845908.1 alkaline phosphatase family protein [Photobacterium damselae]
MNTDNLLSSRNKNLLPLVVAGPILRKVTADSLNFWLVTTEALVGEVQIYHSDEPEAFYRTEIDLKDQIQVGEKAWIVLLQLSGTFPLDEPLEYEIITQQGAISSLLPQLLYPQEQRLSFVIHSRADYVLHGSCRNPHYPGPDSLVAADNKIMNQAIKERPCLLMMSGDQIYADHVAGPMLVAIMQVIEILGLHSEEFHQSAVSDIQALYLRPDNLYGREGLLPHYIDEYSLLSKLFPNRSSPIFSSRECENHLISLAEFIAMYLLVWSPILWEFIELDSLEQQNFVINGEQLNEKYQQKWRCEKTTITDFVQGLPQVQRLFSHIPTYMIFDDHDITDDWNLTVGWEHAAYSNLFSRQIIGNGLIAYWLCQGWGNAPEYFGDEFQLPIRCYFANPTYENQSILIDQLYRFERWHYTIEIKPKVVVLDTRTRRWRSESKMNKPSGLMDWEALMEFQQELLHQESVIIVSAAPMFGVKFIEMLQRMMTALGQPLLIDAENWMAHPGSANSLISIFTHTKTPTNFVILSGDVHYSFAYDIKLRFRRNSPNIYQITCSGFKNEFPNGLLRFCDLMDRLLYSPHSPLNLFTKRKRLKIEKRDPDVNGHHRLINQCSIGELHLDSKGQPSSISILTGEGKTISFPSIHSREL